MTVQLYQFSPVVTIKSSDLFKLLIFKELEKFVSFKSMILKVHFFPICFR